MSRQTEAMVAWPAGGRVTVAWVHSVTSAVLEASFAEPNQLPNWLPASVLLDLVAAASALFKAEETLVEARVQRRCRDRSVVPSP